MPLNRDLSGLSDEITALDTLTAPVQDRNHDQEQGLHLALEDISDQQNPPDPPNQKKRPSCKSKAWSLWVKNWFLVGIIGVIILARFFPGWGRTGGPIRPEYSCKYGVTSCIFLISGLSLKTRDLFTSAMNIRAHLLIQFTSLAIIPLLVKAITSLVGLSGMNATLLAGMAITSATPTTISSNVVMTANATGNESLALFNAALGNLLGVFLSPLLVLLLLQHTAETPSGRHGLDYPVILRDLGATILAPILFGQLYLYLFPRSVTVAKKWVHFPSLNSACLLILVWSVFCDAFTNHTFAAVTAGEIVAISALQAFVFWSMTFFLACMARWRPRAIQAFQLRHQPLPPFELGHTHPGQNTQPRLYKKACMQWMAPMSKQDTVAVLFCGATKSVAMGIPMIKILYGSPTGSALAGLLATPLLIYHIEQLFSGAWMVGWLKAWIARGEDPSSSSSVRMTPKTNSTLDSPTTDLDHSLPPIDASSGTLTLTFEK